MAAKKKVNRASWKEDVNRPGADAYAKEFSQAFGRVVDMVDGDWKELAHDAGLSHPGSTRDQYGGSKPSVVLRRYAAMLRSIGAKFSDIVIEMGEVTPAVRTNQELEAENERLLERVDELEMSVRDLVLAKKDLEFLNTNLEERLQSETRESGAGATLPAVSLERDDRGLVIRLWSRQ